jgi:hypothetical protein
MVNVNHIHGLKELLVFGPVAQGQVKAGVCQMQAGAAKDARFIILVFIIAERKYIDFVPCTFEGTFIQVNIICDAADVRFVRVHHHSNAHEAIVQLQGIAVKALSLFAVSRLMVESPSKVQIWLSLYCATKSLK